MGNRLQHRHRHHQLRSDRPSKGIPEPGSLALLATALGLAGPGQRRRAATHRAPAAVRGPAWRPRRAYRRRSTPSFRAGV
ncbi:PEP-CTERM sorting domain-containing protein [Accumulibacter sp.]|uniref:PEP-CTERM sorting domain-containing protein n=1 Tax=Accumulibacter sp. TaxID=2053492 RepID=UPI00338F193E